MFVILISCSFLFAFGTVFILGGNFLFFHVFYSGLTFYLLSFYIKYLEKKPSTKLQSCLLLVIV